MLVPALLAVTIHEVSHGYIADRMGDPTARLLGRLTFNPIKHLAVPQDPGDACRRRNRHPGSAVFRIWLGQAGTGQFQEHAGT